MKITFGIIDEPMINEFGTDIKATKFVQDMEEKGLSVDTRLETENSVAVFFQAGEQRFPVNTKPQRSPYKFQEKTVNNVWATEPRMQFFFRINKDQAITEFKKHIEQLVKHYFKKSALEEVTIRLWNTKAIERLQDAEKTKRLKPLPLKQLTNY